MAYCTNSIFNRTLKNAVFLKMFCRAQGGYLVSITTSGEQSDVQSFVEKKQTGVDVWTGLSDTVSLHIVLYKFYCKARFRN